MTSPIRILIADDHPIVRDGLVAVLSTQPDFAVIGEAATGAEATRLALALHPAVLLLDLEMPDGGGVETLRQLRAQSPDIPVIVLTAFDTDDQIVGAVRAGAKGYLLKGAPREEIFKAIRVVSAGGSLLQPIVASKLMRHIQDDGRLPTADRLTEREMDVLRLLAQGKANKQIAAALTITERTVKFHVSSILGKLGVDNRTEAVTMATQRGIIKLTY